MTVEKCYEEFGGSYAVLLGRLNKPDLIKRLLMKFPSDPNMENLGKALAANDCDTAFRAAHTLKGVTLNLEMTALAEASSELTEILRKGDIAHSAESYAKLKTAYDITVNAIAKLD